MLLLKLSPFYLWLAIFILQAHKEERFLYVMYPLICFNAAITVVFLRDLTKRFLARMPGISESGAAKLVSLGVKLGLVGCTLMGLSRWMALQQHYGGVQNIYLRLNEVAPAQKDIRLCIGKEWYRFPSHYFLRSDIRLLWIDDGFHGQLPFYFEEKPQRQPQRTNISTLLDLFHAERPGSYAPIPAGRFNDQNKASPYQFSPLDQCDYVVDLIEDSRRMEKQTKHRNVVYCQPFLNAQRTHRLLRAFWIPSFLRPRHWPLHHAQYCLFDLQQ